MKTLSSGYKVSKSNTWTDTKHREKNSRLTGRLSWSLFASILIASVFFSCVIANAPIASIRDNRGEYTASQIPQYHKFEIAFATPDSQASNRFWPYDASAPSGVDASDGISAWGEFRDPSGQIWRQPGFWFEGFEHVNREGKNWLYPTGDNAWKVRFSPHLVGEWQYRVGYEESAGSEASPWKSFTVVQSDSRGFIRVSQHDPRYLVDQNGNLFWIRGWNNFFDLSQSLNEVEAEMAQLSQNRMNLVREWLAPRTIWGTSWTPWSGIRGDYNGYIPRPGMMPHDGALRLRLDYETDGNTSWFDACRVLDSASSPTAVRPNTDYEIRIKYKALKMNGPRTDGQYGLVAKTAFNPWNEACEDADVGTALTEYGNTLDQWQEITGIWNSGANHFFPALYITLENVTEGEVYIESISLREKLADGSLGAELIEKPAMHMDEYVSQQTSFLMDKVLDMADKQGLYFYFTILEKDEILFLKLNNDGAWIESGPDNADGFYGVGRSINRTRWLQQAWWRYLQARWGYSPQIAVWELTNEGDPANANHYALTDELGKYMHCRVFNESVGAGDGEKCQLDHPNHHLVTTSFWHSFPATDFWGNDKYPNVDVADVHAYVSTSQALGPTVEEQLMMTQDAAFHHLWASQNVGGWKVGKPVIRGETGLDYPTDAKSFDEYNTELKEDKEGVWFHNFVWSQLDGNALHELYWFNDQIVGKDFDHRDHFVPFADFLSTVDFHRGGYEQWTGRADSDKLRVVGQINHSAGTGFFWVQNRSSTWSQTASPTLGTITLTGFPINKVMQIEWWDTWTGESTRTEATTTSAGELAVDIDELQRDIALIIRPAGSVVATPSPVPTVTPAPQVTPTPSPTGTGTMPVPPTISPAHSQMLPLIHH